MVILGLNFQGIVLQSSNRWDDSLAISATQ